MGFSSANTNFEMAKWPDVMQIYIFFSPDRLGVSTQEQLCPHLKLIVHMKTKTTVHLESNIGIVSLGCSAGTQHQIPNFIPCDSFALFLSVRWGEARRPFSRKLALLSSFSCVSEKETMASRISTSSWTRRSFPVAAFDELFKAHFAFAVSYDEVLCNFYTFVQTTVYGIDVGSVKESPWVKEIKAKNSS